MRRLLCIICVLNFLMLGDVRAQSPSVYSFEVEYTVQYGYRYFFSKINSQTGVVTQLSQLPVQGVSYAVNGFFNYAGNYVFLGVDSAQTPNWVFKTYEIDTLGNVVRSLEVPPIFPGATASIVSLFQSRKCPVYYGMSWIGNDISLVKMDPITGNITALATMPMIGIQDNADIMDGDDNIYFFLQNGVTGFRELYKADVTNATITKTDSFLTSSGHVQSLVYDCVRDSIFGLKSGPNTLLNGSEWMTITPAGKMEFLNTTVYGPGYLGQGTLLSNGDYYQNTGLQYVIKFPLSAVTSPAFTPTQTPLGAGNYYLFAAPPTVCNYNYGGGKRDTVYYCGGGNGIALHASGSGPYTWAILNGAVTIVGSGDSVVVTGDSSSQITVSTTNGCGYTDTIDVLVPSASIDAGQSETYVSCTPVTDYLQGTLNDTLSWLTYTIAWSPTNTINSGGNTLHPSITPTVTTTYIVEVSTPPSQGGCSWKDSVLITVIGNVVDSQNASICSDSSIILGNQLITMSGVYTHLFSTSNGCDSTVILTVDVTEVPDITDLKIPDVCVGDTIHISVVNQNGVNYQWDFSGGNAVGQNAGPYSVSWKDTGNRIVTVTASNHCGTVIRVDTITVKGNPHAEILEANVANMCGGDKVTVVAHDVFDATYKWLNNGEYINAATTATASFVPENGYLTLQVKNIEGCTSSDSILINIDPCCVTAIPTVFSPNGDGKNDLYRIITLGNNRLQFLRVANRFGEIVFETSDPLKGWDGMYKGEPADLGTYFYLLHYSCFDGSSKEKKGTVILVR